MDAEGIDVAVLFGTELGLNQEAYSPSVCRGYNRWLADYCAADPARLKGVALLPLDDIDAARAELQRAVADDGFVGFFMKGSVRGWSCDAERFHPLYDTAEALGVPLLVHIPHGVKALLEKNFGYNFLRTHVVHSFAGMLASMDAIYGGLLDRFPRLRMAFLESQVGWLPWFVDRLDEQHATYSVRPGLETGLRRVPSAYLDEGRLFFSCDPDERYLAMAAGAQLAPGVAGEDCILWASDYPHSDAIYPGALRALTERDDLSEASKRKLTRDNARRLYGF
jgi:predicted TIM-barrel fold metal-dependent hydrolase